MVAPLLRIEALPATFDGGPFAAVLMTSANAAQAIMGHPKRDALRALPAFTVGTHSAAAARAAGFIDVRSADGDAADLAALVAKHWAGTGATLLYLAGEHRAADLVAALAPYGMTVRTAEIYHAVTCDDFPPAAAAALAAGEIDGVLHYSARSAAAFVQCAERAGLLKSARLLSHYCLSEQTAAPLARAGTQTIRIAARPDETALFALI